MGTVRQDIVFRQGAAFELNVQARNADGTVKDLTGYSGKMQVRPTVESATKYVDIPVVGSITINGPLGQVAVLVPSDVTAAMTWESGVFDLEVSTNATNVIRLVEGFASLSKEVTR